MQKLFKKANLIDIENECCDLVDILIENGKIKSISKNIVNCNLGCDVVDLNGAFVLPSFVNVFCDSLKAFECTYGAKSPFDLSKKKKISNLMFVKNLLTGAVFVNDVSVENTFKSKLLSNIQNLDEKELNKLSDETSKSQNLLFMKVGQNLDELGCIDKKYHKTLSQVLEDFGFLDRKSVVVGGNCLEKDELQLLKDYDCSFVVAPNEDGRLGRRPTNLKSLKHLDFCVGIGSGNIFEIDFFAFCRQIVCAQRSLFEDETCINEKEVLKVCLFEGANILGFDNHIKVGGFANFIVVANVLSLYANPLKTLVWEKTKKDVLMSVFKGEILQKNGEIFMKNMENCDTIIEDIKKV